MRGTPGANPMTDGDTLEFAGRAAETRIGTMPKISPQDGPLTRRGLLAVGLASPPAVLGRQRDDPASFASRQVAAWRPRPLILDDDGDLVYDEHTRQGADAFLRLRMNDCRAAGIRSLAWCIMWGIARSGTTNVRYWQTQMQDRPFQDNLHDPTTVIAENCRKHQIEVFGSIRMNDAHDGYGMPFAKLVYPLKVAHPEMLLGNESQRGHPPDGLAAAMWSGMDFAHPRVREDRLWWIENTARRYNLDGVDLNFFRMPFYFQTAQATRQAPLMTQLIRQARKRLDAVARRRGRPLLLGVRVPGTLESCRRIGLDLETWLRERLVDRLLTGGGYVCYSTPADELVKLGHHFDVPVYPCINCPAAYRMGGNNLRAAASNFWSAGSDGIYLWNFHYIPAPGSLGYGRLSPRAFGQHLAEIGSASKLRYLDKSFAVSTSAWEQYQRASAPAPLPAALGRQRGDPSTSIPIRIGDDLEAATAAGKLRKLVVRGSVKGAAEGDSLSLVWNRGAATEIPLSADTPFAVTLPPRSARQGLNQGQFSIAKRGATAQLPLKLVALRVDVSYQAS